VATGWETPVLASALKEGCAGLVTVQKRAEPDTKPANGLVKVVESFPTMNNICEMYKLGGRVVSILWRGRL